MPLVVIGCAPLITVTTMILNRSVKGSTQKAESAYVNATNVCEESIFAIKKVTAFNGQKKQLNRFSQYLESGSQPIRKCAVKVALSFGKSNAAVFALFAISFAVGGLFIKNGVGNYNGGYAIAVLIAILTGIQRPESVKKIDEENKSRCTNNFSKSGKMKTIARMGYSSASKWQLVPGIIGGIGKGVALPVDALS
jgi:ABC-type multidrug transport system fused ATPase/permease subunit